MKSDRKIEGCSVALPRLLGTEFSLIYTGTRQLQTCSAFVSPSTPVPPDSSHPPALITTAKWLKQNQMSSVWGDFASLSARCQLSALPFELPDLSHKDCVAFSGGFSKSKLKLRRHNTLPASPVKRSTSLRSEATRSRSSAHALQPE